MGCDIIAEKNAMSSRTMCDIVKQQEMMLNALELNYGNVNLAAKVAGISPSTHYRWRKENADYEQKTDCIKDIGYRNLKENILSLAMKKAEKGDTGVLNQLIRTLLKGMPDEMKKLNRTNDTPLRATIRYVQTREEAEEIMRGKRMPNSENEG